MDASPRQLGFMESVERKLREADRKSTAFVDRTGRLSFADMSRKVDKAEEWLRQHKVKRGDRIAVLTPSCTETVALEWATYRIGGIWLGVPARENRPDVIKSIVTAARPAVFLLEPGTLGATDRNILLSSKIFKDSAKDKDKAKAKGWNGFEVHQFKWVPPLSSKWFKVKDEIAVRIRFTSGSTGEPKGVVYTKKTHDLIYQGITKDVLGEVKSSKPLVMIHGAPIAWASGSLIAPVFCGGGCNVILASWDTEEFVRLVQEEECTLSFLSPIMLRRLIKYSEKQGADWARSLRNVLLAGGPMPVPTMRRALQLFSHVTFYTTLGMTEASFPITWHQVTEEDVDEEKRPKRPFVPLGKLTEPYKARTKLAKKPKGELTVGGGALAAGRWNWKAHLKDRVVPMRESHRSRDLLELDEKEEYHYLCRKDQNCVRKNIWTSPDAIEAVLLDCEEVERVRVDRLYLKGRRIKADVTVATSVQKPDARYMRYIRRTFQKRKRDANLSNVAIGVIRAGRVIMTQNGKPVRRRNLCAKGSARSPDKDNRLVPSNLTLHERIWTDFNFSPLSSGPLYFYVGSGLSIASGLVNWDEMACIVWRYRKHYESGPLSGAVFDVEDETQRAQSNAKFLQRFMDQKGKSGKALLSHQSIDDRTFGRTVLLNLILRRRAPRTRFCPPDRVAQVLEPVPDSRSQLEERSRYRLEPEAEDFSLQSLIWRTKCHGVLTPNYDMFLEHAYSLFNHGSALRSYRYNASFLRYIFSNQQFVLKLHGDINDIGTMLLDPNLLWKPQPPHHAHPDDLRRVYSTALANGHMVYVGAGFRDETIKQLHDYWIDQDIRSKHLRIALLPDIDDIRTERRFRDIVFLTYKRDDKVLKSGAASQAVREFLSRLVEARTRTYVETPSEEARDILTQVFDARANDRMPTQRFETKPWSTSSTRKHRR